MNSKIKTNAIPQRATPIKKQDNKFIYYPQHDLEVTPSTVPTTLKRYIHNLPEWKRLLIQSVTEINANEPLIELIQGKRNIIIASDGSKATAKLGGAWVFTNDRGNILVQSHNPDFSIITAIHSRRAEIFGPLAALIFVEEYFRYYFVKIESNIQYHCDNLKVVNKVKIIQNEKYHYDKAYKTTDHDAVLELKELIRYAEKRKRKK